MPRRRKAGALLAAGRLGLGPASGVGWAPPEGGHVARLAAAHVVLGAWSGPSLGLGLRFGFGFGFGLRVRGSGLGFGFEFG